MPVYLAGMNRLLSTLLLASITSASAATVTLQAGQTGMLGDTRLTVIRVQDNRCPINVMCVRLGEIKVSVLATKGNQTHFLKLERTYANNEGRVPENTANVYILDVPAKQIPGPSKGLPITFTDQRP